jgi:hypothetical protein
MSGALGRVLRVRALLEDVRRMELEAEAARLDAIERGVEEAAGEARRGREAAFACVDEAAGDGWRSEDDRRLGEEAGWEWARRRRDRLARLRPGQLERVELAREEFLAGRRDRRRVETLLDGASAAARAEEGRREQRRLDEWFLSRSADRGQRSRES